MSDGPAPRATQVVSVRPEPEPAVLAALMAAIEEAWPQPVAPPDRKVTAAAWRFSGRWWTQSAAGRRQRPVVGR